MQRIVKKSAMSAMCASVGVNAMVSDPAFAPPLDIEEIAKQTTSFVGGKRKLESDAAAGQFGGMQQMQKKMRTSEPETFDPKLEKRSAEIAMLVQERAILDEQVEAYTKAYNKQIGADDHKLEMTPQEYKQDLAKQLEMAVVYAEKMEAQAAAKLAKQEGQAEEPTQAAEHAPSDRVKDDPKFAIMQEKLESGNTDEPTRIDFFTATTDLAQQLLGERKALMARDLSEEQHAELDNTLKTDNLTHAGICHTTTRMVAVQLAIREMARDFPEGVDIPNERIDACVLELRSSGEVFEQVLKRVEGKLGAPLHECSREGPDGKPRFVKKGTRTPGTSMEPPADRADAQTELPSKALLGLEEDEAIKEARFKARFS